MFAQGTPKITAKVALAARVASVSGGPASDTRQNDARSSKNSPPQRHATREPKYRQGVLRLGFGELLQVMVKDLSPTGAQVEFFRRVTLTDEVIFSVPFLISNVKARVVWQEQGSAGLSFELNDIRDT